MSRRIPRIICLSLLSCALVGISLSGAKAQGDMSGKVVRFIIGYGAGGGYDTYSRLFVRHLGNYLPGHPSVVAQNMPGAGSIRAARHLYFKALKDGTVIGMIDQAIYLRQRLGQSNINFDVGKFNWIGRLTNNTPVMITWHESPIKSAKDLIEKQAILFGALSARLDYTFLKQLLGAKIKVVPGYKSTSEAFLAMQRGEIHGMQMPWPVVLSKHGQLVKEKKLIPVLQAGAEKAENLPNVPRMIDIAKSEHDRNLFEFISQASAVGRSVVAPPGLSSDVLAMLRKAFSETVKDPKLLAEARRAKLTLGLLNGEQLAAVIERNRNYPASIVKEATSIAKEAGLIR